MPLIALDQLHDDPRNANICDQQTLGKLKLHIERSGFCPSLLVRPHPQLNGEYMIVDGHHRKQVVESLGWAEIECQVKEMTDREAGLLLLTLNRLRGTDIPQKRAELMDSLLDSFSIQELAEFLPENTREIEGLLALLHADLDSLEKVFQAQMVEEQKMLPVPMGFMIPADAVETVENALEQYKTQANQDEGLALVAICWDVLKQKGQNA